MSKKTIKIGIAAALSGVAVSSSAANLPESASSEAKEDFQETVASSARQELEYQLAEVASESPEVPTVLDPPLVSAMCYVIIALEDTRYECIRCGNLTDPLYADYTIMAIESIRQTVDSIREMGYDVILDEREFCPDCSKKKIEDPELIFQIRFSDQEDYHTTKSNIPEYYLCVQQFLQEKETERVDIVRKMTGLTEIKEKQSDE